MQTEPMEQFRKAARRENPTELLLHKKNLDLQKRVTELTQKALSDRENRLIAEENFRAQALLLTKHKEQSKKKIAEKEEELKRCKKKNNELSLQLADLQEKIMQLEETSRNARLAEVQNLRIRKTTSKEKLKHLPAKTKVLQERTKGTSAEFEGYKSNVKRKLTPKKWCWECPVCLEPRSATQQLAVTPCGHLFCKECISIVIQTNGHCPMCTKECLETEVIPLFLDSSF